MKNAYPEKPVLKYQKTQVEMALVIAYIGSLNIPVEVKRAVYVFFRFESGNGKAGVNNNYTGAQCDGNRWPAQYDSLIVGTVNKNENKTGKPRIFPAFAKWQDSVSFTVSNAQRRGLYIGGKTSYKTQMEVHAPEDLCLAYKREWVKGDSDYIPDHKDEVIPFVKTYKQAATIFPV